MQLKCKSRGLMCMLQTVVRKMLSLVSWSMGKKVSQLITNLRMYVPFEHFTAVEMRVGRIIAVEDFPEARKPAWKLTIDFGKEIGTKRSSAQIKDLYSKEDLLDRLIVGVVNFAPKQIGPFISECLTCGVNDEQGRVTLLGVDRDVPLGSKVY